MFEDPIYEYPLTESEKAQVRLDMSIQQAFSGLDDLVAMSADPLTREMVLRDINLLGQIKSRLEWVGSAIEVAEAMRQKPGLRMVVNRV
jgi:hypothetical protein